MSVVAGLFVGATFFLPIYLPFAISFLMKRPGLREIRIALRAGSGMSALVALVGLGNHPSYGDDAAGDIAGVHHSFVLVWGGALVCQTVAIAFGVVARMIRVWIEKKLAREAV